MTVLRYQDHRDTIEVRPSTAFVGDWHMVGYVVKHYDKPAHWVGLHHFACKEVAEEMAVRLRNGEDYKDVLADIKARK